MHSLVTFIFLYKCESWTLTAEFQRKNTSHGNEVLPHDTTHLMYGHVTNKEVCAKIQQAIGPHEDLLTIVKSCKLQRYGLVSC